MDTSRHCKIIKDMDEKIMSGERFCDDFVLLLTVLRDVVDQAYENNKKMADRINSMKQQVDEWRDYASSVEEKLDTEQRVFKIAQRHYTKKINVANRRAGIWKAKAERLKAQGAN